MSLKNKHVLIIGGSSGFGLQIATFAAEAGAEITITGRNADRLKDAVAKLSEIAPSVSSFVVDAADESTLENLFANIPDVDHLVSMAGGAMGGGFLSADFDTIKNAVDEKLFNNLKIARHAAPKIKENGSMTFTAGTGGRPQNASGAIIGNDSIRTMVQGLAAEVAPKARVNAVAPTWTVTPLWRNMPEEQVKATKENFSKMIPLGRTATIQEVASAYIFMMKNSFITGQTIQVDGGITLVS